MKKEIRYKEIKSGGGNYFDGKIARITLRKPAAT